MKTGIRLDVATARTLQLPSAQEDPSGSDGSSRIEGPVVEDPRIGRESRYWRVVCYREEQDLARSPLQESAGD